MLENHENARTYFQNQWSEILVDEYQDINPSQYRLVKSLLGNRKSLFVVGDDDQAIYGFRGADIGNINRFRDDFKESSLIRLEWRIMAKTINCLHPTDDMEACNECESCVSFNNNASFNIFELDAASNSGVDDIRALIDQVRIPPQIGKYKVYIIDEVHMLSGAAFNAFLKTLEEPPAYAKFILATTEKHKILPTILSRCQIFDFKRITVEDITQHLKNIAAKEGVQAEEEALNIIAQKADGALRDALSIFDQMVSFSGNNITYQDVITNLNVLDYEYYFRMVDNIMAGDINSMLLLLNEVINKGFDAQNFIQGMASHLRNLLLGKDERVIGLMEVSNQLKDRYMKQAERCSTQFLLKSLDLANECDINFRSANNKRLHLEIALMKMVR